MGIALTARIKVKDNEGHVIDEKEVATYAGLLAKAHEEGLKRIETRLVQVPAEENGCSAIVEAVVETEKGVFGGIGDASPNNVGRKIVPHLIRMAETRAKARALRDAVNIGMVALEELGGEDFETSSPPPAPAPVPANTPFRRPPLREVPRPDDRRAPVPAEARRLQVVAPQPSAPVQAERGGSGNKMTENQRRWLWRYLMMDRRFPENEVANVLCRAAEVDSIEQITKAAASTLIESWKNEAGNA